MRGTRVDHTATPALLEPERELSALAGSISALTVIGLVCARRGDPGAAEAIAEALALAARRNGVDGLAPVAAAQASWPGSAAASRRSPR